MYYFINSPFNIQYDEISNKISVFKMSPALPYVAHDLLLETDGAFQDFVKISNRVKDLIIFS